jgi:hypothetical protein
VTTGRFCESCGFDLLMARLAPHVESATTASADGGAAPVVPDQRANSATSTAPAGPGTGPIEPAAASPDVAPAASTSEAAAQVASAAPATWRLVATADRDYHARMEAEAAADAEPILFPEFYPERRFALDVERALVGRRSRSRGIEPEIDLSGAPEDPGISHAHAMLVAQADGSWAVVDLDSANGTYVNDGTDPLPPNTPTPLADGDRVHIGAWTTLTLHAAQ